MTEDHNPNCKGINKNSHDPGPTPRRLPPGEVRRRISEVVPEATMAAIEAALDLRRVTHALEAGMSRTLEEEGLSLGRWHVLAVC